MLLCVTCCQYIMLVAVSMKTKRTLLNPIQICLIVTMCVFPFSEGHHNSKGHFLIPFLIGMSITIPLDDRGTGG